MTTKKIITKKATPETVSLRKVVKAAPPLAKSIDKPRPAKVQPVKSLRVAVKVQTAEGWKRSVLQQHPPKKTSKSEK